MPTKNNSTVVPVGHSGVLWAGEREEWGWWNCGIIGKFFVYFLFAAV
jgi:hypothetical protein